MLDCFNKDFIACGSLFSSSSLLKDLWAQSPSSFVLDACPSPAGQSFSFKLFSVDEIHRALLSLDITKSAGL